MPMLTRTQRTDLPSLSCFRSPTLQLLQSSRSQNVGRPEPDETSSELYRGAGAPAPGAASPAEMAEEEAPGRRLLQKAVIEPVTGQNMDGEGPAHRRTVSPPSLLRMRDVCASR